MDVGDNNGDGKVEKRLGKEWRAYLIKNIKKWSLRIRKKKHLSQLKNRER